MMFNNLIAKSPKLSNKSYQCLLLFVCLFRWNMNVFMGNEEEHKWHSCYGEILKAIFGALPGKRVRGRSR